MSSITTDCNLATAGFMISSELMRTSYDRRLVDYASRVRWRPENSSMTVSYLLKLVEEENGD